MGCSVCNSSISSLLLGLEKTVVEDVQTDDGALVACVLLRANARLRCSRCLRPSRGDDQGSGRRQGATSALGNYPCSSRPTAQILGRECRGM